MAGMPFMWAEAKRHFFDRRGLERLMRRQTLRALSKWGAFVRHRAREMVRKKKRSAPGQPPASPTGLYRDSIFFALDPDSLAVVAGPVRFSRSKTPPVPEILEHGGYVNTRDGRGAYIDPRPHMQPAADEVNDQLERLWAPSLK